jgi:DNA polymerase III epsilon subunit-like protein
MRFHVKHLIFDTETTSLPKPSILQLDKQPRVIEFAGILWDDVTDDERDYEWLFNPGIPIPAEASKISHITDDMVKDAPSFAEKAPAIRALLMLADVVVAHNLFFDIHMVSNEFRRANTADVKWPKGICTVEATEHLQGRRLRLSELYHNLFGETFPNAHRALVDVKALRRCYKELRKREIL